MEPEHFVAEVVGPAIHRHRRTLDVAAHHLRGEPVPAVQALERGFEPFAVGEPWGGIWDTTWFRFRGAIPNEWSGAEVAALIHLGGHRDVGFSAEGLIWSGGRPVQGLHHRQRRYLLGQVEGGESVEFYVEAAANPMASWHRIEWPLLMPDYTGPPLYRLEQAELVTIDRDVEALYLDLQVLLEVAAHIPDRQHEVEEVLRPLVAGRNGQDLTAWARTGRARLAPLLARAANSSHSVTAVGHAHIDTAWLWPVRETRRKCARTFSNQLRLLERYPEHRFACSQAVQYQWIKDDYPELYAEIRAQVAGGRWEPVGGMWVEADTNVPSGESLVRQLVYGKRFFADEFGIETHELWIPDVFGYSAALPQIATQAGVTALVTQKMSWNDTNVFPHSTFWWEGHDGSRVLAHFPPANTYNGDFSVAELVRSQRNFKDHGRRRSQPVPVRLRRRWRRPDRRDARAGPPPGRRHGLPAVEIDTVGNFLGAGPRGSGSTSPPGWASCIWRPTGARSPPTPMSSGPTAGARRPCGPPRCGQSAAGLDRRQQLEPAWKRLLLQQFHDILPGSGIHWVYEDANRDLAEVLAVAGRVVAESQGALAGRVQPGARLVAFNAASTDRREVVELPDGGLAVVAAPACGWATVDSRDGDEGSQAVEVGTGWMENGCLRVSWDDDGLLTSVWDCQASAEVLAAGQPGNLLQLHEDNPRAFDAWNVDREYFDQVTDLVALDTLEIVEQHPLRGAVRFERTFGNSTYLPGDAAGRRFPEAGVPHRGRLA